VRGAGLRLQIVLAVCGLMTLAFVPLYFAVASLARVALHGAEVDAAHARAKAAVLEAADDSAALPKIAAANDAQVCVNETCFGDRRDDAVEERVVHGGSTVVARVRVDEHDRAAPLVRLFAVYMTAFALALAFLVYVALTRLIVKPVEALARATDRVASGSRKLEAPRSGARELAELSQSVQAMTARLLADEESLRRKVDELTEAQAQIVRSERMASVGRLAAGMAHEIGNPITAIMGMQDLMLGGDVSQEESADYVARMRKETERVHGILRDLLDFARPESGAAANVALGPARVADVMNDVVALLKPQKSFREVDVTTDGGDAAVAIAPERLTQVLLNLALNAGDAMAKTSKKRLAMRARREGERVRIEVEDTGPGVRRELRDRLFLPFVTTKEVGQGTGLGLAVCRGIVEAAGGHVELDVNYTDGARFVVTLPAVTSTR
jgi:two-component system NtrC family sensor kinase